MTIARFSVRAALVSVLVLGAGNAFCGGAWVPAPGDGDVQLGFSRKTASSSWDANGDSFENTTRVPLDLGRVGAALQRAVPVGREAVLD